MRGLRGEYSAMKFEIEFIVPDRQAPQAGGRLRQRRFAGGQSMVIPHRRVFRVELLLHIRKETARIAEVELRIRLVRRKPAIARVEHGTGWAAAMVANAVEVHHLRGPGIVLAGVGKRLGHIDRLNRHCCSHAGK